MKRLQILSIAALVLAMLFSCSSEKSENDQVYQFDTSLITDAENLMGLKFDTAEHRMMQRNLVNALESYEAMRVNPLENSVYPALLFTPKQTSLPESMSEEIQWFLPEDVVRPDSDTDLAFLSIPVASWMGGWHCLCFHHDPILAYTPAEYYSP